MPRPFFVAFLGLTLLACVTDEGPGIPAASGGSGGSSGSAGMSGSTSGSSGSGGIAGTAGTAGSGGSTSGTAGTSGSAGAGGTGGTAGSGGSAATAGTGAIAGTGGTGGTGGLPPVCTPGVNILCDCGTGEDGFRTCSMDGQWGPCGPCDNPPECEPNIEQGCLCPDTSAGYRTCLADGHWTDCGPCNGSSGAAGAAGAPSCGDNLEPLQITNLGCSPQNGPNELHTPSADYFCDPSCGYGPYLFLCLANGAAPAPDCKIRSEDSNVACCPMPHCYVYMNSCVAPNPPHSVVCYKGALPDRPDCLSTGDSGDFSSYCCE